MSKAATRALKIFKAGKHTSVEGSELTFSEADLAASAKAYDPAIHEAPLVVGHPKMNAPAYGWVKGLTSDGAILTAAAGQVDASFAELVNDGKFKKISASFYPPDAKNNPVPGVYYLRHVGFLGATPPAIKGLGDASFGEDDTEHFTVEFGEWETKTIIGMLRNLRDYITEKDGAETADRVLPRWDLDYVQDQATRDGTKESKHSSFSETKPKTQEPTVKTEAQLAEEAAALAKREASFAERQLKVLRTENATFLDGLISQAKFPTGMKAAALSFMERLDAEQVVSFGEGDAAPKATELDQFKAFLNSYPASIQFGEIAGGEKVTTEAKPLPSAAELANEITVYRNEQSAKGVTVSFAEAEAAVSKRYAA